MGLSGDASLSARPQPEKLPADAIVHLEKAR